MTQALMDALATAYTQLLLARVAGAQPTSAQEWLAHDPVAAKAWGITPIAPPDL